MNVLAIINAFVVAIGLPTAIAALIYIGRKLQVLDNIEDSSEKVRHNIKVMCDYLTRHHTKFDPKELQSFSPLRLTGVGEKFIKDVNFATIFEENKDAFLKVIDDDKPRFKFEVETSAIKSIYYLSGSPFMDFLKVFFYNHPHRNMENTAPTLGVYIRDKYLEMHPEIKE